MCCRLEELNEKMDSMVQRVKVAEKEKTGLEVGYVIYETCCLRRIMRVFFVNLYLDGEDVGICFMKQLGLSLGAYASNDVMIGCQKRSRTIYVERSRVIKVEETCHGAHTRGSRCRS
jgi:hypothetical protein